MFARLASFVLVTTAFVLVAGTNVHAAPAECAETLVLAVDGTKGTKTETSIDPASPLNKIADGYRDSVHHVEHIEYPGGMIKGIGGWSDSYDQSVAIGKSKLGARIVDEEARCGGSSKYVLLGYSQGARIVGDVASDIDRDQLSVVGPDLRHRVDVRLYADPRQPETGIEVALAGRKPTRDITFAGERPVFHDVPVIWICAPTDGVCDARKPLGVDTFVGYMTTHTTY